jgi:hypothetical protein
VKCVIITHASQLRRRSPTMPKLRQAFRLIPLMLSPPLLRHSHLCGMRGGVEHVPPYILLATVGS